MIKKLRLRFMLVMVMIFTLIILAVAVGIFVMMIHAENQESQSIMSYAMTSARMQRDDAGKLTSTSPDSVHNKIVDPQNEDVNQMGVNNKPPELLDKGQGNGLFSFTNQNPNSMFRNWISVDIDSDGTISKLFQSMNRDIESDSSDEEQAEKDKNTSVIKEAVLELYSGTSDSGKITIDGIDYRYKISRPESGASTGTRVILLDRSVEISTMQRLAMTVGIIAVGGIIFVFILSIFLSYWAVKPIQNAWQQQKEFIANASHELKTPLTVIAANTDVIAANSSETVASQSKWFDYIREEIEKMSKLISSMLYLAKEDRDEEKIIMSEFDGSEVVEGACLVFEALAFEKGKTLETEIEPNVMCSGDKERIAQLAHILIDNAVSHSAERGYIKVSLHRHKNKVRLIVENNGTQISPEDIPHLFERFYRTDKSRTADTGGFGLGLSIAKMIMDKHGGVISVTSSNDGITKFIATW